jgi:radical SAM superfamily enzyme YgiQ (UPF0313 family)
LSCLPYRRDHRNSLNPLNRAILFTPYSLICLDGDTPEYYKNLSEKLDEIDPSSILTSISIPIPGTPFHDEVERDGRIVDRDLSHYEGDHLVFKPKRVSPEEVFEAFRRINKHFYSWKNIQKRWWRFITTMSPKGNLLWRMFRRLVLSFVLFKLSTFQRDHAQKKVYPVYPVRKSHHLWQG